MRNGLKTTEFWTGIVVTLLTVVQQQIWPDSPFPAVEFGVIFTWIAARLGEKTLGPVGTNNVRAYKTTEFYVAIGFALLKQLVPELPAGVENFVMAYIIGRPAIKVTKSLKLSNLTIFKKKD